MPRKLRVEYPGAIYHVTSQGNRLQATFKDDEDRHVFMEAVGAACAKTGWQIHAFCLLPNRFDLVVETPRANLVAGMKWLVGTYTGSFNRRHRTSGSLFRGRYKALIVDESDDGYLKTVCDFVHLHPAGAKWAGRAKALSDYPWSSLKWYLQPRRERPVWLCVERLLAAHGIAQDSVAGRREFGRRMEKRGAAKDDPAEFKGVRRGWYLGDLKFRRQLLAQMKAQTGKHGGEDASMASSIAQAQRIVRDGLKRLGWTPADLNARAKGHPEKVKLAARLRAETTVTLKWVAKRLRMGVWTGLNHLLYLHRRAESK